MYYIHKKSGDRYALLQDCKFKHGDIWADGVIYIRRGSAFVRTREDFEANFTAVPEPPPKPYRKPHSKN